MPQPDELFQAFWKAYPRRVAKGAAEKAWKKLKPTAEVLAQMLEALDWQTRQPSWRREDGAYIPYPASWLNARRWEDEAPASLRPRVAREHWRDECERLHAGRCTSPVFHAAKRAEEQET